MSMIGNIGGQSGGGILTKSILIVTAPTGSTVTVTKGSVTKAAAEKNGEWWFRNLDNGEWTITATKNTLKAIATYSITQFGVYRKEITYFQATINVTYPAGSTCTASNGDTTLRAPDTSGKWTCIVPNAGSWTISGTLGGQSDRKTVSISSDGQTASVALAYRITPEFTYTGSYQVVDDNDSPISDFASWKGNWKIRFLTSGTLTFKNLHGWGGVIDLFLVGGGGSGGQWCNGGVDGAGGGGGYTTTSRAIRVSINAPYQIVIASGGASKSGENANGNSGGSTTAFGKSANGGSGGQGFSSLNNGGNGGSGGGGGSVDNNNGGAGGSNGGNGTRGAGVTSSERAHGGEGQGSTTREFGDPSGKLYAGGGAGSRSSSGGAGGGGNSAANGATNTGGGGGGGWNQAYNGDHNGGAGGSGIAIIRNAR